jgi:tetratricopeptide (TPR) repeat protein
MGDILMQRLWIVATIWLLAATALSDGAEPLAEARRLLIEGKYAEAIDLFGPSASSDPAAALGLARAMAAQGRIADAQRALEGGGEHAELSAELARLAFERGDREAAEEHVQAAIRHDPDQVLAHWIRGEMFRTAGRLDEAEQAYARLIRYYNDHDVRNADWLRWIGLAAARYAEWNRAHDQYRFLISELYPGVLQIEPGYWPAHYEAGRLLLAKHNHRDAMQQFQAALALNPNAAEVHAAVARAALETRDVRQAETSLARALELNPELLEAHQLRAELAWANFQPQEAMRLLREVALPLDPTSEETLGRLAACYVLEDGLGDWELGVGGREAAGVPSNPQSLIPNPSSRRFAELVRQVTARNEHAGEFFFALAEWLAARHKLPEAERCYEEATRRMPRQVGAAAALGMMWMDMGREAEAKKQLDEAIDADPFDVRTSNMLSVLEVLDGMRTLESEQVILRYDAADELLARYAVRYLDEVYPELCAEFGYRPAEKPLVEIFRSARGASGHAWFSTRMIGLPYIGTVAASTGKIVAMVSPNDEGSGKPFNWARVLTHEMVHVVTLQQTRYNIPHWYTEALAVRREGYPRSQSWNELLVRRVRRDDLFDLGTINFGFARPGSGEDWQLAYCQSELYAEYLVERYGPEAIPKLLSAYADNLTTDRAVRKATGATQEEFERGYREYVETLAGSMASFDAEPEADFTELLQLQRKNPDDARLAAQTAYAYIRRGAYREAEQLAVEALKLAPGEQLAAYVLARLLVRAERPEKAVELLEASLDPEAPDPRALNLLAALELKAEDYAKAARWYRLGARREPENLRWARAMALVYAKSDDNKNLIETLARLARADANDLTVRKELAKRALAERDFDAAADWANQALWIDVEDAEAHRAFAEALSSGHNYGQAIAEFRVAIELDPTAPQPRLGLADACVQNGQADLARRVLEDLLQLAPNYPGADILLESLKETAPR